MIRKVKRLLPDGREAEVSPFHISLEGLESCVLCRDDEDYDVMVKYLFICARRKNVLVIIYVVVSNHAHIAVLAEDPKAAAEYGVEIKKMYSMWFSRKYGERKVLERTSVCTQLLDSDWYLRNALAYIPRNALDNGAENVELYKWTGYRAMFCGGRCDGRPVSTLSKRDIENIMHTADKLSDTAWILNDSDELEPASACDWEYLEMVFNHDQAFFLKCIGGVNSSEMMYKLDLSLRKFCKDSEFYKILDDISRRWFELPLSKLSIGQKSRLLPYVKRSYRTGLSQLARCFGLTREQLGQLLGGGEKSAH